MTDLHVFFIDELTVVEPGNILTFGRTGDIEIDEANRYMHRVVGTVFDRDGVWWLTNNSTHASLTLVGSTGRLTRLPPEAVGALNEMSGAIRFDAGPSTYELGWALPGFEPVMPPTSGEHAGADVEATTQFGVVNLNEEQRQMLVVLAERTLRDSSVPATDLPTNAAVAHRLGWTAKKLDRKLDYLCARLASEGVRGLRGEKGFEAVDRRSRLVDHVVGSGMIRSDDLTILDEETA